MMRSDFSVECDGCGEITPPRSSETMALVQLAAAGWRTKKTQKFSGVVTEYLCPKCRMARSPLVEKT